MDDVIIIGAGVSSVFLAYSLRQKSPKLKIRVIDKGKPLKKRSCGLDDGKPCTCNQGCDKYIGFAGLGKSEGKFNYTNDFGGELWKKIGKEKTLQFMREVDQTLCSFGADQVDMYSTKNEQLSQKAAEHGLEVLSTEVRHLGTKVAKEVFQNMYEWMKSSIPFSFEANVKQINKVDGHFIIQTEAETYQAKKVVLATGKSGSEWMLDQTGRLGLKPEKTRLDLGVRVEMRGDQLNAILQKTFETKLKYTTDYYTATTYCMNPCGRIIRKHQHGLVMPDGQNQHEEKSPSRNINFTLFVPRYFSTYEEAKGEAEKVIGSINKGKGRIVAQRLEDLRDKRTSVSLLHHSIHPSLDAEPGDLWQEVPKLYINALLDFLQALEGLLEEKIHPDTILYGLDSKFYEAKIYTDPSFESEVSGLYLAGDCSGETHSLSQAAASGVIVAGVLSSLLEKE